MKNLFFGLLFSIFFLYSFATDQLKKTICLNMIVKNESHVIERCLKSVKDHIDYWVIVDTGSTDGTQDIIKNFMKDVPGELHQRDWVNFEHNRNQALQFAKNKGDYLLFLDADEQFLFPSNFKWSNLDKDSYYITCQYGGMRYPRMLLVNNHLDWKWIGVLHEYLDCREAKTNDTLKEVVNLISPDGARSKDPDKYKKDALILEKALEKDPTNCRYVFYLAQSYRDANELEKAIEVYEKRISMGGFMEEVFWSQYQIALLQELLKKPPEVFLKSYCKAFLLCPDRAEPLNKIATYYRFAQNYKKGYEITKLALSLPYPTHGLFVEEWVYSYNLLLENSIDAYWIGKYEESEQACLKLLQKDLPQNVKNCVENNLKWAKLMISSSNQAALKDYINSCFEELISAEKEITKKEVVAK